MQPAHMIVKLVSQPIAACAKRKLRPIAVAAAQDGELWSLTVAAGIVNV